MPNLISYGKQSIDKNDEKNVLKALRSDFITQGPLVEKFEDTLKKYFNSKYSIAVTNGSAALFLIGKILGWKKGDLIAVPPITFISSVNSIEHCNAKPIFVDITMTDYCMDHKKLEKVLKNDRRKKIKAAIITDYGGQPANWKEFYKLKKKYRITLINDNCHSIGSTINADRGYAAKYADLVSLSFHPVKAITTGEGGAILTNFLSYAKMAKKLRSHGIEHEKNKYWQYKVKELGYNFRLPDFNCAFKLIDGDLLRSLNLVATGMNYSTEVTSKLLEVTRNIKYINIEYNINNKKKSIFIIIRDTIHRFLFIIYLAIRMFLIKLNFIYVKKK